MVNGFDKNLKAVLQPTWFEDLNAPMGFLVRDKACHALWRYYITALETYKSIKDNPVIEVHGRPELNYYNMHQLWLSVATLYDCNPNDMAKFWPAVDLTAKKLGLTKLEDPRFRNPKKELM